jgi:N-acetyl-anhydromuramyl-L-alanine amidase AmpD
MSKHTERISKMSLKDIIEEVFRYAAYWVEEHEGDEEVSELISAYQKRFKELESELMKVING